MKRDSEKLIIIDDESSIRDSLSLLFSQSGFSIATFQSAEEFVSSTYYGMRCCAVIDVNLAGLSGIDALQIIAGKRLPMKVIMISAYGTPRSVRDAFKAEAFDFIEKPYDPNELIESVRRAFAALPEDPSSERLLTPREEEIRTLLLKGMSAKEIAIQLGISPRTVETHKGHIFEKLQVKSTLELVVHSDRLLSSE